jgi:hypothetical protein
MRDPGKQLSQYANDGILVDCPACGECAHIRREISNGAHWWTRPANLTCGACGLNRIHDIGHWQGAIRVRSETTRLGFRCGQCGMKQPDPDIRSLRLPPTGALKIRCIGCRAETEQNYFVEPIWQPETGTDPYFALPLHLRTELRGQWVWAYNKQHLADFKTFLGAKIRERAAPGHKSRTAMNQLPRWMTSAKTRSELVAALAQLEKRAA